MANKKKEKQNKILVPAGAKKQLVDMFDVSYPTVRKALNGVSQTYKSHLIRKAAIVDLSGVEINDNN